jgi:hypothetical protein
MLPVTTTSSSYPFAATVCFVLAASTRFLQLPGRSVISFPTHRRNDFLGIIHPSFEFYLITIRKSLTIFPNCRFQLNQLLQPLLIITALQALQ